MSYFVLFHWMMIQIFIAPTVSEAVVRGTVGQAVTLPCSYRVTRRRDVSNMCWGRGPCPNSKCSNKILHTTGSEVTFRASQRYNLQGYVSSGDVSLTIGAAKAEDAGLYCCRVEIPGLFNDIKRNIRLELARAPPVTTTTTTRKAPVFSEHFTETFAPQATSDLQPTTETAVLLTTSTLPPETTVPESPAVTTGETSAPPTTTVTEKDIFPVTMVETSTPSDFPTTSQAADVTTEDIMFCSTLPGNTEVTTEFPDILPTSEETTSSVMMEEMSVIATSLPAPAILQTPKISLLLQVSNPSCADSSEGNMLPKPFQFLSSPFQFPSSAILIACAIAGSILLVLMISLVWKRKHMKKFIAKSVGPPEETDKVFSGAEGENNIFSL
ncbi:TIMD4 protein, partial [Erythrocercus mccallii]|nr:TIMD4 protein [Erythrocercus mccallii]